jgi:hypothetical protein
VLITPVGGSANSLSVVSCNNFQEYFLCKRTSQTCILRFSNVGCYDYIVSMQSEAPRKQLLQTVDAINVMPNKM